MMRSLRDSGEAQVTRRDDQVSRGNGNHVARYCAGIVKALMGLLWLQLVCLFDQEGGAMSSLIVMVPETRGWLLLKLGLMYFVFAA